jgi:molybdopterin-containing oxidoreductase family membrane subunit
VHPPVRYDTFAGYTPRSWAVLAGFGILAGLAGLAAMYMESNGHWVTGMTQRVVWGFPHVCAFFLIVVASGALNIASIGSVFHQADYQPLGRLSVLLAFALLAGGLFILVTDLGRADRLMLTLLYSNATSVFAWNVFIYQIFFALTVIYLWVMMSPGLAVFYRPVAITAFLWRLGMTTGTGSVLGFLVARAAFRSAIMPVEFVALSLSLGGAMFMLTMLAFDRYVGQPQPTPALLNRFRRLLGVLVAVSLYMVAVQHLWGLYEAERRDVEHFILFSFSVYSLCLWVGFVLAGSVLPMLLLFVPIGRGKAWPLGLASALIAAGGVAFMYGTVIGAEVFPLALFPGRQVASSAFDGVVATYQPSLVEVVLGIGGFGIAGLLVCMGTWVLPLLPGRVGPEDAEAAD